MIMWYAWSPAAQLGQSLNLMHKENHGDCKVMCCKKFYCNACWLIYNRCHDGFDLQTGRASRASTNGRHVLELRLNPATWLKSMPEKFCPTQRHSVNFEYH